MRVRWYLITEPDLGQEQYLSAGGVNDQVTEQITELIGQGYTEGYIDIEYDEKEG